MRRICYLAVVLFAFGACSSGGDGGGLVAAATTTTFGASADLTEDAPACTALPGTPTDDVMAHATCANASGIQLLTFASYGCPDGRRLVWNDYGWGYTGGTWQAHARADGQLVPPDADMAACPDP